VENLSDADRVMNGIERLLEEMRERKPNNRSEEDRYWAITITEVEKAMAIFKTFVYEKQPTPY